ncbi:hypothetical protein [Hymenobacter coalescens]
MQKLLEPQTYSTVMVVIWAVMLPMIVKDSYGFVPSLIAAMLAGLVGFGLAHIAVNRSARVKWATMIGSLLVIVILMVIFVEPASAPNSVHQAEATK